MNAVPANTDVVNNGAADVEEEPDLPVGVAVEGLRKVFKVLLFGILNK